MNTESITIMRWFKQLPVLVACVQSILQQYRARIILALLVIPTGFSLWEHAESNKTIPISFITSEWDQSIYFNTSFLCQYDLVNRIMKEQEGFASITFTTSDGLILDGLYKEVTHALGTIIFCAGFYPGRKEGIATFIKMVPDNYNLFFFDARGHGISQGPLWSSLSEYGLHEYKDVIAALAWVHEHTHMPIIIHGLCAGAFHAAKAITKLIENNSYENYRIKALIFDSGVSSMPESCVVPLLHVRDKTIPSFLMGWYTHDTKHSIKSRWLYTCMWSCAALFLHPFHWYMKKKLELKKDELNLATQIHTIPCPILFIHAKDDGYSSYASIQQLIQLSQKPQQLVVDDTDHAVLHLKHKYLYRDALQCFLNQLI